MDTQQLFEVLPHWNGRVIVTQERGCWEWAGDKDRDGYSRVKTVKVPNTSRGHRITYALLVGPIPEGLSLDHLCEVRHCVNPEHLDPCTIEDNIRAGAQRRSLRLWNGPQATATQLRMARGVCVKGHVLAEVGALPRIKKGVSVEARCKACQHETQRKHREKNGIATGEARGAYGSRDPKRKKRKYKGVSWNERTQRWKVAVYHKGKNYYSGEHIEEDVAGEIATKLKADLVKEAHRAPNGGHTLKRIATHLC